jgi:WD40 repeat protein
MKNNLRLAVALVVLFYVQARGQAHNPEVLVQAGHASVVMSLTFSPDGRICASGSRDQTIKLWDTQTGHLLRTLTGHEGRVTRLVFSADGQALVSESEAGQSFADNDDDDTNILWQVDTGRKLVQTSIGPFALSPDGQTYAAAHDGQLKLWDAHTGQLRATLAQPAPLVALTFSLDSRLIAASTEIAEVTTDAQKSLPARAQEDTRATVWDTQTGRALFKLDECSHPRFSPDGKEIYDDASSVVSKVIMAPPDKQARYDEIGRVYSAVDGHLLRSVGGALVAFAPDGPRAVRWDGRQTLDVVDLASGQTLHSFAGYVPDPWRANGTHVIEATRPVRFSPAGGLLALEVERTGQKQDETQTELWDTRAWCQLPLPTGRRIYGFSPDEALLLLGNEVPAPDEAEPKVS